MANYFGTNGNDNLTGSFEDDNIFAFDGNDILRGKEKKRTPFIWSILLSLLTFIGLAMIVFTYIILTQITIYESAAPPSSLVFMLKFI